MKIETLKERIEKKEAQIARKQNTISKKMAQIEKKSAKVKALGYDPEGDRYQALDTADHQELYWMMCDIDSLKDDIKRGQSEIEECKATLEKYKAQLAGEMEREAIFIKEVPQAMKDLEARLITEWDASDLRRKAEMYEALKELGYTEFIKKHKYGNYELAMYTTKEQIHNANVKDARFFVLDLLNRVKEVTGEVTDWSNIYLDMGNRFPLLTGEVYGKEGNARVESIYAGGYNIQRLHIRTLVHSF